MSVSCRLADGICRGSSSVRGRRALLAGQVKRVDLLRGGSNGVALLVINADQAESYTLEIDRAVKRYTLSAPRRSDRSVELNGRELALTAGGDLPQLAGARHPAGPLTVGPRTITFLTAAP
jgi:hypothetical protein